MATKTKDFTMTYICFDLCYGEIDSVEEQRTLSQAKKYDYYLEVILPLRKAGTGVSLGVSDLRSTEKKKV